MNEWIDDEEDIVRDDENNEHDNSRLGIIKRYKEYEEISKPLRD